MLVRLRSCFQRRLAQTATRLVSVEPSRNMFGHQYVIVLVSTNSFRDAATVAARSQMTEEWHAVHQNLTETNTCSLIFPEAVLRTGAKHAPTRQAVTMFAPEARIQLRKKLTVTQQERPNLVLIPSGRWNRPLAPPSCSETPPRAHAYLELLCQRQICDLVWEANVPDIWHPLWTHAEDSSDLNS